MPAYAFPLAATAISFSLCKGDYIGRDALLQQFQQAQKIIAGLQEPSAILPRRILPIALVDRGVIRRGR